MILSNEDIKKMLAQKKIRITPLNGSQIGPASVDLTLSDEWKFFRPSLKKRTVDLSKTEFQEAFVTKRTDTITLKTGQMCLARTKERITLPTDIMGKLEGRSRYARMGLVIHITSALVQPGSDNHQVLEIVNLAPFPIKLRAGMRISQVVFQKMDSRTTRPYKKYGEIARDQ